MLAQILPYCLPYAIKDVFFAWWLTLGIPIQLRQQTLDKQFGNNSDLQHRMALHKQSEKPWKHNMLWIVQLDTCYFIPWRDTTKHETAAHVDTLCWCISELSKLTCAGRTWASLRPHGVFFYKTVRDKQTMADKVTTQPIFQLLRHVSVVYELN